MSWTAGSTVISTLELMAKCRDRRRYAELNAVLVAACKQFSREAEAMGALDLVSKTQKPDSVPPPPLVGVELNPGPRSPAALVKAAASVLKPLLSKTAKKHKKTKKTKSSNMLNVQAHGNDARVVTAPAAMSLGVSNRIRRSTLPNCRVKFDVIIGFLNTTVGGAPIISTASGSTTGVNSMDLNPAVLLNGISACGANMFSIAASFMKHRLLRYRMRYQPLCPSSTPGGFIFAFSPDPYIVGAGALNVPNIGSLYDNITVAAWQPTELEFTSGNPQLELFNFQASTTDADERLSAGGTLLLTGSGLTGATTYGMVSASGELEFIGLGDEYLLQFDRLTQVLAMSLGVSTDASKNIRIKEILTSGYDDTSSSSISSSSASLAPAPKPLVPLRVAEACKQCAHDAACGSPVIVNHL